MSLQPVVTANVDPAGTTNWVVTIRDGTGATQSQGFTVNYQPPLGTPTPSISSLSLTSVPADSVNRTLTIYGSNFAAGNVVQYRWLNPPGGNTASATVNTSSQISVPFNPGSVTDTIFVKVCQSSTSTACSGELSITVTAPTSTPTPSISSLSLTSVPADSVSRTLTIYGSNFAAGNVVQYRWLNPPGGNTASAIVNSTSQISVSFNPGSVTDTIYVKVCQSSSSTACSGELSITVTAATLTPYVSSVSPTSMTADGASHSLTIYGSSFAAGDLVQFMWLQGSGSYAWHTGSTPTINSSSQITTSMNPGTVTDTIYVRVCNSSLTNCSSGTQYVSVTAATLTPYVSSVSPTSMTADGASHSLTIYGSSFAAGDLVQFMWLQGSGSYAWHTGSTPTINSSSQITTSMNPGTVTDTIYVRVCNSSLTNCSSGTQYVSVY